MAKGTLGQVIQRAISDAAFRNRLRTDPGGALSGFDLTPAERAALQSGDAKKLASFGVDQRMSKTFAMGEAASGASRIVGTDVDMGTTIPDGGTPLGTNAILEEASGTGRSSIDDGDGPFLSGSVDDPVASGRNALGDQHDVARSAVSDDSGSTQSAIRDDGGPFDSGSVGSDTAASGGTSAFITADEAGNDVIATGASASSASLAASDSNATDAFLTADEMGNSVSANDTTAAGWDGPSGSAYLTADEAGRDQDANSDAAKADPEYHHEGPIA